MALSPRSVAFVRRGATGRLRGMATALAVIALAVSGIGHLLLVGLCVAGMPNSSPAQMRHIQMWMVLIAAIAILTIVAGALLIRGGHPWWCVGIALVSPVAMFVALYNLSG